MEEVAEIDRFENDSKIIDGIVSLRYFIGIAGADEEIFLLLDEIQKRFEKRKINVS